MKNNYLFLCLYFLLSIYISGCGGGTSGGGTSGGEVSPITPFTKEHLLNAGDISIRYETGDKGSLRHTIAQNGHISRKYTLKLGIPSLNVVEIKKKTYTDIKCDKPEFTNYSFSEVVTYDYKRKKVIHELVNKGKTYNCSYSWQRISRELPTTLTDSHSIGKWLNDWGNSDIFIIDGISTCPEDILNFIRLSVVYCKGFYLENVEVIDDKGNSHKITYKESNN